MTNYEKVRTTLYRLADTAQPYLPPGERDILEETRLLLLETSGDPTNCGCNTKETTQ